jgi:2-aminoadipate transaminase
LDPSGNVIQLGSFSKMAFPGLRVGWMLAPRAVVQRCSQAKQWCDLHTDHLSQAILLRCAESGLLARHREQVVRAGRERLLAAVAACSESLPAGSLSGLPQGGMNLWVNLPVSIDASELARRAALRGVSFLPGNYFEVLKRHSSSLRLSFAGLRPEVIREGIAILGRLVDEELSSARPGGQLEPAVALV